MARPRVPHSLTEGRSLFGIVFLLLLPFLFFWRETLGLRVLGAQDAVFWFVPAYHEVVAQLRSLQFPLWNPLVFSGMPLFASWQAGVLDPLNLLYLLTGVSSRSLTLVQQLSFSLSAISAYAYARSVGVGRRGSIVTGVIYAFSGYPVARTLYPGLLHVTALMPLNLFLVERMYQQHGTNKAWRLASIGALAFAWQIFAAHPQPLVYSTLLVAAYIVFRAFACQLRGSARWHFLAQAALMLVGGAALASVQLLPAYEFAANSVRQDWSFEMFTLHSLHPLSLLVAVVPFLHGGGEGIFHLRFWGPYWHHNEAQIYLGALAISFAIGGAVLARRSQFRPGLFWTASGVAGVILALGKYSGPLAWLLYRVPLISDFRSPNRYWMIVALSVAVLAGYAIEPSHWLSEGNVHVVVLRSAAAILLLVAALAGVISVNPQVISFLASESVVEGFSRGISAELWIPVGTALISLVVILAFVNTKASTRYYLLLGAMLLDYSIYAHFAPTGSAWGIENRLGSAVTRREDGSTGSERYHVVLNPASGEFSPLLFYGAEMSTGYDPLLDARYKRFTGIDEAGRSHLASLLRESDRTLDLLDVREIIVAPRVLGSGGDGSPTSAYANDLASSRWKELGVRIDGELQGYRSFENQNVLPRAWLVSSVRIAHDEDQLKIIRGDGESWDPKRVALISPEDSPLLGSLESNSVSSLEGQSAVIERKQPSHFIVRTQSRQPALLVVSENFNPGWKATVDGSESRVIRANYMLRGVVLSPGEHRVEFRYQPRSLWAGTVISVLTLLVLGVVWVMKRGETTENTQVERIEVRPADPTETED